MKPVKILGFKVDRITYDQLLIRIENFIQSKENHKFILLNPYLLLEARRSFEYADYIKNCDIITADGVGLILAGWVYAKPFPERVTGTDLMPKLAERAAQKGWKVYFLGAKPGIAEKAYQNLKSMYPKFNVVGIHHGYFSNNEEKKIVDEIKSKKPDILVVCLGAYKQERFIQKYQKEIAVPVAFGTGASFDFWAGRFKRAPRWMQKYGLEWLFRLIQEPKRLWKRYLIGNTIFMWLVFKELLKKIRVHRL